MLATQQQEIPALFERWLEVFETLIDSIRPKPFYKGILGVAYIENADYRSIYRDLSWCFKQNTLYILSHSVKMKETYVVMLLNLFREKLDEIEITTKTIMTNSDAIIKRVCINLKN